VEGGTTYFQGTNVLSTASTRQLGNIWNSKFGDLHAGFAPLAPVFAQLPQLNDFPDQSGLSECASRLGVITASGIPIKFVPARPRPRGAARRRHKDEHDYELRIFKQGEISTRSRNWHDFFNALVWMTYPATKAALNARQIAARVPGVVRTREQDRLTMFDEGGVVTVVGEDQSVLARHIIGHAIFELICGYQLPVRAIELVIPAAELENSLEHISERPLTVDQLDQLVAKRVVNQVFQSAHSSCLITR